MSFQWKGTPVAIGVVNRFDRVMMILCGSPLASLTSRKPSAPAPPALLTTISDSFISLCLTTMPWIRRAIWSAPPPVPAGTTNSTGLVGSQAAAGNDAAARAAAKRTATGALRAPIERLAKGRVDLIVSPEEVGRLGSGPRGSVPLNATIRCRVDPAD